MDGCMHGGTVLRGVSDRKGGEKGVRMRGD